MRHQDNAISGQEIELKLEITPHAAEALIASDLLPGSPSIVRQRSVYFETPGRDLSAAGFSLRIREIAGRRIQTVKAVGAATAGLFARPEWEFDVEGDTPVFDDTTPVRALLGDKVRDIGPIFAIEVERRIWSVPWDGATIEFLLDRGEVVAGERSARICEIELELKGGSPLALFSFARRIDAMAPLRLGVVNKAERGFRLLEAAMRAVKAEPVALTEDTTAADAFRRIAGACLRQFRLNEPLIERDNPEAVHQARVALRRLRSAFSIFRPMLEDAAFPRLREESRWLAGTLGDARDLDVLRTRCDSDDLAARLEQARAAAYAEAASALASQRARALMLDLSEWLALGEWQTLPSGAEMRETPARDFAASALDRFRRKVKKGGRDLADLDDAARHEVRKDAKKLRYAAEFFAPLFQHKRQKRRATRFLAALEALQDRLGALNDLATAPSLIARAGLGDDLAAAVLPGAENDKQALIETAAEAHDALADAKRFWR